ncbi:LOW QUALITY PROTEIN: synaptogyrin-3 [Emys orbicularis]|uniref:LOW QUALITY PROTEIN: synaptogyrin-3 n=1 Tax=Emys orbicularis TaxID=82168 RepID=UPI0031FC0FB3
MRQGTGVSGREAGSDCASRGKVCARDARHGHPGRRWREPPPLPARTRRLGLCCTARRRSKQAAQRLGKMEGASFGAGRAGGTVDPVDFLKQPQTILRIVSWVFSIVVFGSIINEGYVNDGTEAELRCVFKENEDACNYGIAIGIIAFFVCIFFFIVDLYFQQISSVKDRKRVVLLDLGFSGLWSFLWFVAFCFLANQWQHTPVSKGVSQGADAARAAIAFSFFSILSWVALTVMAMQRYHLGTDMSLFATDQFATDPNTGYPGYPTGSGIESTETYQSPPFSETLDTSPKGYQVPTY